MPNRLLKEGICTSDAINSLSSDAEVLFYRLLVVADDYGRMDARMQIIKSQCFPLKDSMTSSKIEKLIQELAVGNLITFYKVSGKPFLYVNKWDQRQRSQAKYPDPENSDESSTNADCGHLSADGGQVSAGGGLGLGLGLGLGEGRGMGIAEDARNVCPYQQIVDLYHECMPNNPRVAKLDATRKSNIKARWDECARGIGKMFGYKTVEQGLACWREIFEVCADSKFLTGQAPSSGGRKPFIADIDFIFNQSRFTRIIENKYHEVSHVG